MNTLLYLDYIIEAQQIQQEPPPPNPAQVLAQISAANVENIQKYILFNKVLVLKYQLENSEIQKTDYKTFSDSMYFLNVVINFFTSFTINDLMLSVNYILDNIIKSTNLQEPNLELVSDNSDMPVKQSTPTGQSPNIVTPKNK
jgi:hypothetical protein